MSENKVTEDGLIEKALRVMGARRQAIQDGKPERGMHLDKLNAWVFFEMNLVSAALFIHESELFLTERGYNVFRIAYFRDHVALAAFRHNPQSWECEGQPIYTGPRPTKHEAYAKAVLAASGQEIGQAEPQAPSTTSHQTETRGSTTGLEKGGKSE